MSIIFNNASYSDHLRDVETQVDNLNPSDRNGWEIAVERVRENDSRQAPCYVCKKVPSKENQSNCLRSAVLFGQKPEAILYSDGLEPYDPTDVFPDAAKPKIFRVTTPDIPTKQIGGSRPSSPLSAFQYGKDHLKIDRAVTYGSDQSPMPKEAVDYWLASDRTPFTDPRLPDTRSFYDEAVAEAAKMGKRDDIQTLYRLASLTHIMRNAERLGNIHEDVRVIASYYDSKYAQAVTITPQDTVAELFHGRAYRALKDVQIKPRKHGKNLTYCCLCCDARASNVAHRFGTDDVVQSNSISILVPPRGDPSNETWLGIDRAVRNGANLIPAVGHSDCGGIAALIASETGRRKGDSKSFGIFIDRWLEQGRPVVAEVLNTIDAHPDFFKNISQKELHELVTRRIKMWSAGNINKGTPKHVTAIACYEDLHNDRLEFLPLGDHMPIEDKIKRTFARMRDPQQKIIFPDAVAQDIKRLSCPIRDEAPIERRLAWTLDA